MKKILSVLLVACLCCGVVAGCGSPKKRNTEKDSVLKKATVNEYYFELPDHWEDGENTSTIQYFYPEDGMLMVGYAEMNGSITDEVIRKSFVDSFGASMEGFTLLSESEMNVSGLKAYRQEMNIEMGEEEWTASMVTFDSDGGVISFLMSTLKGAESNYDEDFERILKSVKSEKGAVSSGENSGQIQDAEAVRQKIDVRAVPALDGLVCVFITNNSDAIIDELNVQLNFKDASGTTIDMGDDGHDVVLPGSTVVSRIESPENYETYEIETEVELGIYPKYVNHSKDVVVTSNQGDKCIIVELTNNSDVVIEEMEYIAVLYKGDQLVTVMYPEDIRDVPVGKTVTEKTDTYSNEYDRFEVYLNQAHTFGL